MWLVKAEFYDVIRVRGDAIIPFYHKDYPISTWKEDDYLVIRKKVNTKEIREKVVLLKDPFFPKT